MRGSLEEGALIGWYLRDGAARRGPDRRPDAGAPEGAQRPAAGAGPRRRPRRAQAIPTPPPAPRSTRADDAGPERIPATYSRTRADGGQATARLQVSRGKHPFSTALAFGEACQRSDPARTFEPSTHEGQLFPAGRSSPGVLRAERRGSTGTCMAHRGRAGVASPWRGWRVRCRGQASMLGCIGRVGSPARPAPAQPLAAMVA